jgi:Predicted aminoglycoside phosphotransferase
MPFFALYLTSLRHLSISEAALIISLMGLGSLASGVCGGMLASGVCGGMLADILGRRVTILVSLLTAAVLMFALSFAVSILLIVVLAILYKLFNDLAGPAISAAIADMTPRDKLAQAYSLPYWANNIGSAIGPIIAGVLAPVSYLLLFLGDALTTFCFGALIWYRNSFRKRRTCMGKMHIDEIDIDVAPVARLLSAQFPQWTELPIEPVPSAGTNNALYRLGPDLAVRLPRIEGATGQMDKEHQWLPRLAPHLPLAIPVPLAMGEPGEGYPWPWSVYRWLEGESAESQHLTDQGQAARDLAHFIMALQRIDLADWPPPLPSQSSRGVPLSTRDAYVRSAIAKLSGMLDTDAVTAVWDVTLQAPEWHGPPILTHGDLLPGNLLVQQGRLSAVIDFEGLGVGDPACDLIAAWSLLSARTRDVFRAALSIDDATWARGQGWPLSIGLIAFPYYQNTNPVLAATAHRMITEVLADHQR